MRVGRCTPPALHLVGARTVATARDDSAQRVDGAVGIDLVEVVAWKHVRAHAPARAVPDRETQSEDERDRQRVGETGRE